MTDDARRPLSEEERGRIRAARHDGGLCAICGRVLAEEEPVWIQRVTVGPAYIGGKVAYRRVPVCGVCAAPSFRAETEGTDPEPCVSCGRGVYYHSTHHPRQLVRCSRRCAGRYHNARVKEARGS